MSIWLRLIEFAIRPVSMGIALVAQAYLLQKSADGFLVFNAIFATQNILAHVFYPGIATSAFRAANGFSKVQIRLFYVSSAAVLALAIVFLSFWSAVAIALIGTVLTAARTIMAQYYLGEARPVLSSMLTQILPWTTLIFLLAILPNMALLEMLPLLMAVPSSLFAFWAILRFNKSQMDSSLQLNWRLGAFSFMQSFKEHGISLLAAPFSGAEVAGALFMIKLLSAAQNIVAYAGARQVKRFSIALRNHDQKVRRGAFWSAVIGGVFMGAVLNAGVLLAYFQPVFTGFAVLAALDSYIIGILLVVALLSPFMLTRYISVNVLDDGRLFLINLRSVIILLSTYAAGPLFLAPGVTIFVSYTAASLFFLTALTLEISRCQRS